MGDLSAISRFLWPDIYEGRQPQFVPRIKRNHPRAKNLYLAWLGTCPDINLVDGSRATNTSSDLKPVIVDRFGRGINFSGPGVGTGQFRFATRPEGTKCTVIWVGKNTASGDLARPFSTATVPGSTGRYDFYYSAADTAYYVQVFTSGGSSQWKILKSAFGNGGVGVSAATIDASNTAAMQVAGYYNGLPVTTANTAVFGGSLVPASGVHAVGGRPDGTTRQFEGTQTLHLVFDDILTPAEIAYYSNPANLCELFEEPEDIWPLPASSGSALSASASGADQASGSASLAAQVALAAIGVTVAGGNASVQASVPLSAAGLDTAGGSANASATVTISAAGLAQAAGQAGLSAQVLLAGAGAAQASGNAALAAQLNALAAGAAQAGGSANLTGGAPGALSAAGGDVTGGSAVLSVTVNIAAAGASQSGGSASITGNAPGQGAASGGAQSGGSGTISTTVQLTADGFVQAMGSGQWMLQVPLSADGRAIAGGAANLSTSAAVSVSRAPTEYPPLGVAVSRFLNGESKRIRAGLSKAFSNGLL